ncbi:MAG: 2-C-methyl-D-erythritol 4-phosphate cytidylyltransferase [Bacteroidota bacterium]
MPRRRSKISVVVPAAGMGSRLGGSVKKQFALLKNKPVLAYTLQRFEQCADVDEIAVAVPEESIVDTEKLVKQYRLHKVHRIVAGGAKRQDSVFRALSRLALKDADIVLVHDGVRPFIEPKRISHLVRVCREHDAAVLAVQPKDTIRRSNGGGFFDQTLDRSALWLVQTPQAFKAGVLLEAFSKARQERFYSTDEAALVERLGIRIKIVEGSYDNIKITTNEDLEFGAMILERWRTTGTA